MASRYFWILLALLVNDRFRPVSVSMTVFVSLFCYFDVLESSLASCSGVWFPNAPCEIFHFFVIKIEHSVVVRNSVFLNYRYCFLCLTTHTQNSEGGLPSEFHPLCCWGGGDRNNKIGLHSLGEEERSWMSTSPTTGHGSLFMITSYLELSVSQVSFPDPIQ